MKIDIDMIREITLSELTEERLDPITITTKDYKPGEGEITIKCYNKVWTAGWGAMSGRTVSQFFCSCDNGYLISNLSSALVSMVPMEGAELRAALLAKAKELELDTESFDFQFSLDDISKAEDDPEFMQKLYGPDWYYYVPEESNPDYEYLNRIVNAVKAGLQELEVTA